MRKADEMDHEPMTNFEWETLERNLDHERPGLAMTMDSQEESF